MLIFAILHKEKYIIVNILFTNMFMSFVLVFLTKYMHFQNFMSDWHANKSITDPLMQWEDNHAMQMEVFFL